MAKPTPLEPPVTMAQRGRSELRSASPKERFIAPMKFEVQSVDSTGKNQFSSVQFSSVDTGGSRDTHGTHKHTRGHTEDTDEPQYRYRYCRSIISALCPAPPLPFKHKVPSTRSRGLLNCRKWGCGHRLTAADRATGENQPLPAGAPRARARRLSVRLPARPQ